jgi:hypothetical protein
MSATLTSGVTDLAGNSVSTQTWGWTVPEWLDLASPIAANTSYGVSGLELAVDGMGNPTIALSEGKFTSGTMVFKWNGSAWDELPGSGGIVRGLDVSAQGEPAIVWTRPTSDVDFAYAARWTNAQWAGVGVPVCPDYSGRTIFDAAMHLTPTGDPFIAVAQSDPSTPGAVITAEWDGSQWTPVCGTRLATWTGDLADLEALAGDAGSRRVTWREPTGIFQWVSGGNPARKWPLPFVNATSRITLTRVDRAGIHPVALVSDDVTPASNLRVWQYSCPSISSCGGDDPLFWGTLGNGSLNINPASGASAPALALDGSGFPVVAWVEDGGLFVKRWTGGAWQQMGSYSIDTTIEAVSLRPTIAVGSAGHVVVGWTANTPHLGTILNAKRYNR